MTQVTVTEPGEVHMTSKRWSVLGTALALSALAACGGAAEDSNDSGSGGDSGGGGEVLKVGVYGPAQIPQGQDVRDGAQLAADEINEDGGVDGAQIEIVFCDSENGAKPEKVDAIVGGFSSGETLAMLDTVVQAQIPYLSTGAASPDVVKDVTSDGPRKYIFRVGPISSTSLAADMCLTVVGKLAPATGWTKFGILYEDVEFARPLNDFLQKCLPSPSAATGGKIPIEQGVQVVATEKHLPDATDFSSQFSALQAAGAQYVIEINSRQEGVALAKQWGTLKPPFALGGINVAGQANGFFEATGGGAAYQLNGPAGIVRAPVSEKTIPFYDAFEAAYDREPIYNGASAYDAMYILKDAVEAAGSTEPDAVVAELAKTDTVGAQGVISFNEAHDVVYGGVDPKAGVVPVYFQFTPEGEKKIAFPEALAEGYTYVKPPFAQQ
jgi:branched-chain amino acid transport system substrate-binding protein